MIWYMSRAVDTAAIRGYVLALGAVLWGIGNALHPPHSASADQAPTWTVSHLMIALGAVLMAVGLPTLIAVVRTGTDWAAKLLGVARGLLVAGLAVLAPISAYRDLSVAPRLPDHEEYTIDAAFPLLGVLTMGLFLGFLLLGWYALVRPHPMLARIDGAVLVVAILAIIAAPLVPARPAYWIVPAAIAIAVVLAAAGVRVARHRVAVSADSVLRHRAPVG